MIVFVFGLFCLKVVLVLTLISRMDTFYIYLFGDKVQVMIHMLESEDNLKDQFFFFYDLVSRAPTYIVRLHGKKNGSHPVRPKTLNFLDGISQGIVGQISEVYTSIRIFDKVRSGQMISTSQSWEPVNILPTIGKKLKEEEKDPYIQRL